MLVHLCFLGIESQFFALRYAFYYAVSIKVCSFTILNPAMLPDGSVSDTGS